MSHNMPEEEMTERGLTNSYEYFKGWCQENRVRLSPVVPWDRTWGNKAQTEVQEVPPECEEKFLHCVSDRALVQAAQKGCGVCSEDIQNH